ncbi:MAG: thiamine diphosphokinase [Candidatus Bipolaricaulota bacterium]|nr:thiamine diphosphokinase [Candidatus Bipolaricaulota bacterium]
MKPSVLILANGRWDNGKTAHALRRSADVCLATDGAWAKARAAGVSVDAVIGDLDSLSADERADLSASGVEVISFPHAKNWTDLELALDHALQTEPSRIVVYGALGERIDHTLTNLHLLERGLEAQVPIECVTTSETIRLIDGDLVLSEALKGDAVSLVPITESVRLSTQGLEYELHDERLLRAASRGVSNVVRTLPVRVLVADGRLLVIHTPGNAKEMT